MTKRRRPYKKRHTRPMPKGEEQARALAAAKFLRKEGDDVLSQREWNIAADLEIDLSTAPVSTAAKEWLFVTKKGKDQP